VIKSFKISAHGSTQICTYALLQPGSQIAIRIDDTSSAYQSDILSVSGTIFTTPDYDELLWATDHDNNALWWQWIPIPFSGALPGYQNDVPRPWFSNVFPYQDPGDNFPPSLPNRYDKRRSLYEGIGYFIHQNFSAQKTDDPYTSIFLTNYQDRGPNTYRKKVYQAALTSRVLPSYQEKIQNFINSAYSGWVLFNRPLLSSFKTEVINFFLDIHVGVNEHPQIVIDYFWAFGEFWGKLDWTLPSLYTSHIHYDTVFEYLKERANVVINTGDTSTITYWWHKAGLVSENLFFEMLLRYMRVCRSAKQ